MKHTQELSTKSFFINRYGQLSESFLFWQIQDIAWEHAEILGFGYNNLQKEQQFWVLSRILVKISRRPKWGEKFTIETWPVGTEGILALRDICFKDQNGDVIIRATTSWLVLNQKTKRIERFNRDSFPFHDERIMPETAGKVVSPDSDDNLVFSPALFNEVDINQHLNSGRYLERIIDSYGFEFHEKHELMEFEINFAKEGIASDKLAVKKQIIDSNNHLCSIVRESDRAELIKSRLLWQLR